MVLAGSAAHVVAVIEACFSRILETVESCFLGCRTPSVSEAALNDPAAGRLCSTSWLQLIGMMWRAKIKAPASLAQDGEKTERSAASFAS